MPGINTRPLLWTKYEAILSNILSFAKIYVPDEAIELYKRMRHPNEELKVLSYAIVVYDLETDLQNENYDLFNQQKVLPYHALDKIKMNHKESSIRAGLGRY